MLFREPPHLPPTCESEEAWTVRRYPPSSITESFHDAPLWEMTQATQVNSLSRVSVQGRGLKRDILCVKECPLRECNVNTDVAKCLSDLTKWTPSTSAGPSKICTVSAWTFNEKSMIKHAPATMTSFADLTRTAKRRISDGDDGSSAYVQIGRRVRVACRHKAKTWFTEALHTFAANEVQLRRLKIGDGWNQGSTASGNSLRVIPSCHFLSKVPARELLEVLHASSPRT